MTCYSETPAVDHSRDKASPPNNLRDNGSASLRPYALIARDRIGHEKIDLSELSTAAVQDMVQRFKALDDQFRQGIVSKAATVMDSEIQAGILSFYEHISEPELVTEERIFETEEEALAWLGHLA